VAFSGLVISQGVSAEEIDKSPSFVTTMQEYYQEHFTPIKGFLEGNYGQRLTPKSNTKHSVFNMAEQRLQLETAYYPHFPGFLEDWATELKYRGELLVDEYVGNISYNTREFSLFTNPMEFFDVKAGRQILTWGVGDYIFINDMFPKDYISFFIGRDDEYLKVPSDAVKTSFYTPIVNIDAVFIPWFQPNIVMSGDRLSFYDPYKGRITGQESERYLRKPPHQFEQTEIALRLFRTVDRYELAGYFFRGFYKNPRGFKNNKDEQYYPPVLVFGGSARGPLFNGIVSTEVGYKYSLDNKDGTNRMLENSSVQYLVGYAQDLKNDINIVFQYYVEQMLEYSRFKRSLMPGDYKRDHFKQLLTFSFRKDFFQQTLHVNSFIFFSPTDVDTYWRPSVTYDINDRLKATLGANLFWGENDYTEFGQAEENKNIYVRVRYSF